MDQDTRDSYTEVVAQGKRRQPTELEYRRYAMRCLLEGDVCSAVTAAQQVNALQIARLQRALAALDAAHKKLNNSF